MVNRPDIYDDIILILLGIFVVIGYIFAFKIEQNSERRDNSNIGKTVPRGD